MPIWLHFVPWHWLLWLSVPFVALAGGLTFASAETAALLKKVPKSWWVMAAVIVLGSLYHVGTVASAANGAATAQAAKDADKIDLLKFAVNEYANALKNANAQAAMDKANSDAQMKRATLLLQQVGREAVKSETDLAAARARIAELAKSPNCATTASLKLCPAMQNY